MTTPDLITIWEWEGSWKLVRATTLPSAQRMYARMRKEAMYLGSADPGHIRGTILTYEDSDNPMFVLDPDGRVVLLARFIDDHDGGYSARVDAHLYGNEPEHDDPPSIPIDMGDRWARGILRFYGMVAMMESQSLRAARIGQLFQRPPSPELDPDLSALVSREFYDFNLISKIRPWLITGHPPEGAEYDAYLLLGLLPPAFTEPHVQRSLGV